MAIYQRRFAGGRYTTSKLAHLLFARGAYDSAATALARTTAGMRDSYEREVLAGDGAATAGVIGRARAYDSAMNVLADADAERGNVAARIDAVLQRARYYALVVGDRVHAKRLLDSAMASNSFAGRDPADRPNADAVNAYALVGDAAAARRYLPALERQIPDGDMHDGGLTHVARANVAIAERRWDNAVREVRASRKGICPGCGDLPLALAYGARGDRDSAVAAFERARAPVPGDEILNIAQGPVLRRLGELYEAKGDLASAADRYERFVKRWQHADPELQPQVAEIRKRVARLQAREGRTR